MMIKRYQTWLLCLFSLIGQGAMAQVTNFTAAPRMPLPGGKVEITYDPAGTPLQGRTDLRAVISAYNNYQWQVNDLPLKAVGNKFKASVQLDKQCGIIALKFISGDSVDNNHNLSYVVMTGDPVMAGKNAAGAYAGWSMIRGKRLGYGVPGFLDKAVISDTAFYYWLNNEIVWHPKESSMIIAEPFAKALYAYQGSEGLPRIGNVIKYLCNQNNEQGLLAARNIYRNTLGQKAKADSLDSVMVKSYPKGNIARLLAYKALTKDRDPERTRIRSEEFLVNFPISPSNAEFDRQNFINYGNVYQTLILLSAIKKDFQPLDRYLDKLPFMTLINLYYRLIDVPHSRKDIPDLELLPRARQLFRRMTTFQTQVPPENWNVPLSEWAPQYEQYVCSSVLPTHINILRNTDQLQEALGFADRAERFYAYKKAMINDDYAFLLNKTRQYKKLHDVLIRSVHENQSSPEMLELLKADHQRNGKGSETFESYLQSLKNSELAGKASEHIRSVMRSSVMPDWTMSDLEGRTIQFSSLRDKTIVMDFWATWCVPCKASFPGMKMAVERYKNDPNVVFYFVDTEERGDSYKQEVAQYIRSNNYPFQVLFDNRSKESKINDEVFARICKAFTISGIPMKLVIDPAGKLRFLTDGFKGSATELADEISEMVELVKNEGK